MVRTLAAALCVFSLMCLGCGSGDAKLGEVTGKVTMDNEPLAGVLVTFTPADGGRSSTATTKEDGTYTLGFADKPGALIGMHKVSVKSLPGGTSKVDSEMSSDSAAYEAQAMGGSAADYENATVAESIPAKYNTETTLEYEVKKGSNTIDIELTK